MLPILRKNCLCLAVLATLSSCSGDNPVGDVESGGRGAVVSSSLIESVSISRIESYSLPVSPRSAVDLIRVIYETVDALGNPTTASAMLAIPTDDIGPLAVASYQHGTVVRKNDVASVQGLELPEALVAVVMASTGYLGVMPDYLGLGVSSGLHPFVHGASLATAVTDALRAARNFGRREGVVLEEHVYLLGYSEGGYATAAAQKHIEANLSDEFTIGASAIMAASFDLSGTMVDLLASDQPYSAPFFLPYTLLAYNSVYSIDSSASAFLSEPYDTTVPPMFDGTRSGGEIDAILPSVPKAMLRDAFVTSVETDDNFAWRMRLEENTLLAWTPASPTRIYHCDNDELIPVENSLRALEAFRARGAPASRVDLVTGDYGEHAECAPVFILLSKFWIDEVRNGGVAVAKDLDISSNPGVRAWRPLSAEHP